MKKNLNNNSFPNDTEMDIKKYYSSETVRYEKFIKDGITTYTIIGDKYSEVEKFLYYMTRDIRQYRSNLAKRVSLIKENNLRKVDIERLKELVAWELLFFLDADEEKQLDYSVIHDGDTDFYHCEFLLNSACINDKQVVVSKLYSKDFSSIAIALPKDFTVEELKKYLIINKDNF